MNFNRRLLVVATVVAYALIFGTGLSLLKDQLSFGPPTEVSIQPRFVSPSHQGNDPLVVGVGFTWTESGYCSGQFNVRATETTTQVRVGAVISRTYSRGACAGLGTDGKLAWTSLTLAAPIGQRSVIRESDGAVLPQFSPGEPLACKDAIANSYAPPPADRSVVFDSVALPTGKALQVSPSGESDPTARLFAKAGLYVASGRHFLLAVPDEWLGRLTMAWGNPGTRTTNVGMPSGMPGREADGSQGPWLVFPGGFWVDQPACVPLIVRSGDTEQTVHIGVGAACPGQAKPQPGT